MKGSLLGNEGDTKSDKNLDWELTVWHEVTCRNNFNQGRYKREARRGKRLISTERIWEDFLELLLKNIIGIAHTV